MRLEDLGLVGNCQYSALIDRRGTVVWCCMPRFDSAPVFGSLLDEAGGGRFEVGPPGGALGTQRYLENTNVLETRFADALGAFRVLDFAPRFSQYARRYRPTMLMRVIEPLEGTPRVCVTCSPTLGWAKKPALAYLGSNHVQYEGFEAPVRLTADLPLSYLGGRPFALTGRVVLAFTWGQPVEEALGPLADRFLTETVRYWQTWVKHCTVPPAYQQEVIRSALALKLHCFEDTGAIVAAMTTSIPEAPDHSGRTWDYRYCWLRDAYYALAAFRLLGHFEERESFTRYLLGLAASSPDMRLAPLYRIDGSSDLAESTLDHWAGFEGHGPVRVGNGAAVHVQNDIFGEMVLALAPVFFEQRFWAERSAASFELIERLATRAVEVAGQPDAGIWEYRTEWVPQTFSCLMSWAAADRVARICREHAPARAARFAQAAVQIKELLLAKAWSSELGSFTGAFGSHTLDAALLQMAPLRFLAGDARINDTVNAIQKGLAREGWVDRYRLDDGFGRPQVAFTVCTFWLVEALARLGRVGEARQVMEHVRAGLSPLGLISEDFAPDTRRMWGNFPQAYSHVGMIHAAFAASPTWAEVE